MTNLKELLNYYQLPLILGLNREELDHLFFNSKIIEEDKMKFFIENYDIEDILYLTKGKDWDKEKTYFQKVLNTLSLIREVKASDEGVKKLVKELTLYPKPWSYDLVAYYVKGENIEKIERLLKGLSFHESLLNRQYFFHYMTDKGIENFRKLYGKSEFKGERIKFLNLTNDLDFIEKTPEDFRLGCEVIVKSYGIDELKALRDENFQDDYFFSDFIGTYDYKEYEDELIDLWKKTKSFLKN